MKRILLFLFLLPFAGFGQVIPAGDYVISSTYATDAYPTFKSLTSAVNHLNANGISGDVKFLLDNDQTAISQITINAFNNAANNTVTIKPNISKNVKITVNKLNPSSGVPAVFLFNGTKNIIIDGSNSTLDTKNLELINNDDIGYLNRSIIWIASNSSVPSTNITVKNTTLRFVNRTQQTNLLAAIYSGNNGIGGNNTINVAASTASNSNITVGNNEFVNVKEGVNINGNSNSSIRPNNWNIQNNKIIGGATDVDKLSRGIYVSNSTNFTISNNLISGVLRYSNSAFQETAGISIIGESSGKIDGNVIDEVRNINYASDGSIGGIFLNTNIGTTITVSNNMISKVYSGATDSNNYNYYYKGFGIYVKSGGTTNLYFNTVVLNHSGAGGLTSCLYLEGGTTFNITNNIFYNSQPGTQYGIFIRNISASNINTISNNAYYITNATGNFSNRFGDNSYTGTTGFPSWKTAIGNKDTASIIKLPNFMSPTDFHLQDISGNSSLKTAMPISGITTDIDGHTRSLTTPYMGADEIFACVAPATPTTIIQPMNKCSGTSQTYSIAAVSGATLYTWSVIGTGWSVTAGEATTSATITIGSGAGTVSVTATNGCGTSTPSTVSITPDANLSASVSIAASPSGAICSGTSVTLTATPANGGTNPSYQWKVNGVNAGTNSSTFTTAALANNDIVTVVMTSNASPCLTGSPATSNSLTMSVNPRPTPSFTTPAAAQTCAGEHMTYSTEAGYSNYIWTVSGILDTDYRLIDRGTSTDNYIVIEWLTAGPKIINVNYNNSNGCNGAIAATYSTMVTVLDRGRVNGGTHICKGATLPTLTLRNDAGNAIYSDPSLVLKWQYSDDLNNATWHDIAGTGGQISYTPTAFPGSYRTYQVILKNGNCTKTSIESRINIDVINAPTLGATTYPTCTIATGSVVLNDLPAGNWELYINGNPTPIYINTTANRTSYTITDLAAGTYTFTVKEGNCISDASVPLNMSQVANIWDGSKWSKTGDVTLPTSGDKIVFQGDYNVASDITGCSCTVNSGNVIVNSGRTLTITNEVNVNGGTLTFENNASLVQINDVQNTGSITYKRNSQPMKNFDYSYWSSPVTGQTTVNLSPNTLADKYHRYDPVQGWVLDRGIMQPGIGYIIRVPKPNFWPIPTASSYIQPVEFKGIPNNGEIPVTIADGNFYLMGNPYPSALDADKFLYKNIDNADNDINDSILGGTIYFWTHNTGIKQEGSKYVYVSDDYAAYNKTGSVKANSGGERPEGYIAAGQSFFVKAEGGSGTVKFTNKMRIGSNNTQFFKPSKTSKSAVTEKHRLWLNMSNAGGAFKQTLIGYVEGATNTYDKKFDGLSFDGNSYIDFYSVNEADKLTIQARALPFSDTDVVPLGYRSTIAGDFTIAIDQADGNLASQRVYLEDKQTGTINELTAGNYTFTTKAGTFNNRFVLRYTNKTLGTGDFETQDAAVWVMIQNKTVTVNSTIENIDKVFIYDVSGKQLYQKEDVKNLQLIMQNLPFAQQVVLVKVVLDNGYQTTRKLIFK
jgi:hypothetical protein